MISDLNTIIAIGTVRILAGILFFFQGYDKVFKVGMAELQRTISAGIGRSKLPADVINVVAIFTSYTELLCGFLLIIGFFKYFAMYLLCLDLLIVSFGFSLAKPMWDPMNVFSRLLLLLILMLTPVEWDKFSFDYLFELSNLKL